MRIAISKPGNWGGALTMAVALAEGLAARGHEIVVFAKPDSPLQERVAGRFACEPILWGKDFPPAAGWRCLRAFRRHGTEVLLSATPRDLRFTGMPAVLLRLPVVVRAVASDPFMGLRRLERRLLRSVPTLFVSNSEGTRAALLRELPGLAPDAAAVVHNGIDVERFASATAADLGLPPDAVAVGYVGRLGVEKGVRLLPEMWGRIAGEVPEAHLVVVGSGPLEEELRQAMAELPRIHWLGFRRDIDAVMPALDLLVMPSRVEGFGLAAAEALAAGVPVAATRVGGLVEVVRDGTDGLLVEPGDAGALAAAAVRLARDPALRERMGAAGQRRMRESFSLERMIDGYEAALQRATAERAP